MRTGFLAPAVLACVALSGTAGATTYYVSALKGRDGNSGLRAATAFKTLQHASSVTRPGDTVLIMSGTYVNPAPGDNVLLVTRSGAAGKWITYEAALGQHPVLHYANSWAAVSIDANYVIIKGLEISGNADSVTYAYAKSQSRNLLNPLTNGDGIDVVSNTTTTHHVTLLDNVIHDVSGGGIAVQDADYITIQGNIVYNTSWWSPYGDSGISVYEQRGIDNVTGYKTFIIDNVTYGNDEYFPCMCRNYQSISDGNGIIVDDNLNTQSNNIPYGGRTLVAYNVSYDNGGSGLHAYSSQHVDFINNTAYHNDTIATPAEGQIFSDTGNDINITNNILFASAGVHVTSNQSNTSTVAEDYNMFWSNGALILPGSIGAHDIKANPLFVAPSAGNFTLSPRSPALGSAAPVVIRGTLPSGLSTGIIETHRDRGAY